MGDYAYKALSQQTNQAMFQRVKEKLGEMNSSSIRIVKDDSSPDQVVIWG